MPNESDEQLVLDAMPAPLFSCTPSRLVNFDCPRRYRLTYLDRPTPGRGAPWAHNTIGAVVHLALQRWWSLPAGKRNPDNGGWLVERNWQPDGFRDEQQSLSWRSRAAEWVRQYLDGVDPDVLPVGVERSVASQTELLAVSGRVDRIDDRGGELVIVDYKTGRHVPSAQDAGRSLALAVYALGARRTLRRDCRRVELHHLPTGQVLGFDHSEASLQEHVTRAEATARAIIKATDALSRAAGNDAVADELFPTRPGERCSWCDFRRHCAPGRASSPALDPWSGLAEVGH